MSRRGLGALLAALPLLVFAAGAMAQWLPSGALAKVPVVRDCDETGGDVAVSRLDPPTIYLCPRVVDLVRKKDPGAEQFYLVHEYGHIALATSSEAEADCWAARELAKARNGERYLNAAIRHFERRPDEPSTRYGSPGQRAQRIRDCAEMRLTFIMQVTVICLAACNARASPTCPARSPAASSRWASGGAS
jgi:hypothetical protein